MAEKFSAVLRHRGQRIWRAIEPHPFLRELHAGTLPMDRFTYFILQDYVYLLDFAQVLCQGAAKSPDLETLELFARHALGAVEVERSFHASFGKTLGTVAANSWTGAKGPITQAYIGHLQSVARSGSLSEIVAAVLPCYWIYGEAGRRLQKEAAEQAKDLPGMDRDLCFRRFLEAGTRANRIDGQHWAAAAKTEEKKLLLDHFILSSRYEFMFWEQAYRLEQWPI